MNRHRSAKAFVPIFAMAMLLAWSTGCGKTKDAAVDPAPFEKAVAEYLERNNMAMALKEIKDGPTVDDKTATMTASLTHATLGGPAVTWQIRFGKAPTEPGKP